MAVVRAEFIQEVDESPARRILREHLQPDDQAALVGLLRAWLSDVVLAHRTTERALRKIIADGRFKNKAEVGSPHPTRPPELERRIWTIETDDPADLPIYGYAAPFTDLFDLDGGDKTRRSLRDTYGPVRIVFKNEIRPRTTFTLHDSLWRLEQRAAAPSLVDKPSHLSWPNDADLVRKTVDRCGADEFVEIQVLGGVYTDDVEMVLFDDDPEAATTAALDGRLDWRVAPMPEAGA